VFWSNPELAGAYDLEEFFIFDGPIPPKQLSVDYLVDRLTRKITQFEPEIVLVHTGLAFDRFPVDVSDVILAVSRLFPHLRIGLEEPHHRDVSQAVRSVLDTSEQLSRLQLYIFGHRPVGRGTSPDDPD
jgi:hypothetical protein